MGLKDIDIRHITFFDRQFSQSQYGFYSLSKSWDHTQTLNDDNLGTSRLTSG